MPIQTLIQQLKVHALTESPEIKRTAELKMEDVLTELIQQEVARQLALIAPAPEKPKGLARYFPWLFE